MISPSPFGRLIVRKRGEEYMVWLTIGFIAVFILLMFPHIVERDTPAPLPLWTYNGPPPLGWTSGFT